MAQQGKISGSDPLVPSDEDGEDIKWLLAQVTGAKNEPSDDSSEYYSNDKASRDEESRDEESDDDLPVELRAQIQEHLELLTNRPEETQLNAISSSPLFTGSIWRQVEGLGQDSEPSASIQYGLLGGNVEILSAGTNRMPDPRVFHNITTPMSAFICGSQGSGKSHTLSCLLENCLIPSSAAVLPKPLTGVVFHYDTFTSDTRGSPCEAAYLSSNRKVRVRVLCAPTNLQTMKRIYSRLPNVKVEQLLIGESDLNTTRMLDLMAASGKEMPLYLHVVQRVLRDMRLEQQQTSGHFVYADFKKRMAEASLQPLQSGPLQQRLDTLESFMPKQQTLVEPPVELSGTKKSRNKTANAGTDWSAKASRLTIVDLSCPCVTPDMACSLFNICLSLFLERDSGIGRVVALDEAHKYMNDEESSGSQALTNSLLETIRLQRHLGTRVIISTQEPSISPKLLDLCSVTVVHRFSSPDWLDTLHRHLAGASRTARLLEETSDTSELDVRTLHISPANPLAELFSNVVNLQVGEALLFAPSAAVGRSSDGTLVADSSGVIRLGTGIIKIRVRTRITTDGGRSVLAN